MGAGEQRCVKEVESKWKGCGKEEGPTFGLKFRNKGQGQEGMME